MTMAKPLEPAPDASSLRAALSMIDDWDSEFSSLFELEATPPRKAPRATAPYKPRRGDARKLEALELRAQIQSLQRVVERERAKFVVEKCEDSVEALALRHEWESMSASQEKLRFAAQVENEKLRALVATQRKSAQKVAHLAQKVAMLEQQLPPFMTAPFEHYQGPKEDPQKQLQRLDAIADQATRVFKTGAFAKEDRRCFREVQFRDLSPEVDGVEIKIEMAWLLPFDAEDVAEALWIQSTRITAKDKSVEWMDLYEDATSIVSQFVSTPTIDHNLLVNHGQIASRRLPRKEGDPAIVFISNNRAKAFDSERCKGEGEGHAWIRIEPVASHKQTARIQSPLTQVKWARVITIYPPPFKITTSDERSQWINGILHGPMRERFESNLDWNLQAIENILLGSKLSRPTPVD